jgi:excisionase family DNA binding protein
VGRKLLTLRELAESVRVSPRTLRNWVRDPSRALPAFRVGGKLLFSWEEVERWLQRFRISQTDFDPDRLADEMFASTTSDKEVV